MHPSGIHVILLFTTHKPLKSVVLPHCLCLLTATQALHWLQYVMLQICNAQRLPRTLRFSILPVSVKNEFNYSSRWCNKQQLMWHRYVLYLTGKRTGLWVSVWFSWPLIIISWLWWPLQASHPHTTILEGKKQDIRQSFSFSHYLLPSKTDHVWDHKASLSKFLKTEIISSIFSKQCYRLEISYKKKTAKTHTRRLNNMLPNNQWITEEIKEEIRKSLKK